MDLSKIYGIEFDEAVPRGGETRILDAAGLRNDYVVGNRFQHSGINDFDDAYPFGAVRTCNISCQNGERRITYENEPGFCRTGENGNVMVRIPRFYSRREKHGTVERWLISGTRHPGFMIEPVFMRDGKELDAVYVGVYNTQCRPGGLFSLSGGLPDVCKRADSFCQEYAAASYDPYDLAMLLCLQKLIVIEFGTRYVKQHLGGIGFLRYFSRVSQNNHIRSMGPNRITISKTNRGTCFAPGHEIGMGHTEDDLRVHATILHIAENPRDPALLDIDYDGPDLRGVISPLTDAAYGIPQKNGLTDTLPYHTGRSDLHCLDPEKDILVNAFRYRGIENVWGNVWEFTEGLRIRELRYHYTFDPSLYATDTANWKQVDFPAPHQHYLTDKATALWTDVMGFDSAHPLLLLPAHSTGDRSCYGDYYDSAVYSYLDKDYTDRSVDPRYGYRFVTGGGYDHSLFGSLFTYRGFITDGTCEWLNSSRVCLRRSSPFGI